VAKYEIQIFTQACTGCLSCQLACSDLFWKSFEPSRSRIQVTFSGADCSIHLGQDCNHCGVCVDHCFYDALQKTRSEARR
jgi:Fe-S-cluster-containing dehydrogenase component